MDLINIGSDPWILEYEACEKLAREIMEHLNDRNSEKASQAYDILSAKIRIKLKQFSAELSELNKKLSSASFFSNLTQEERERRKRQVETLQGKEVQLRDYFNQRKIDHGISELVHNKSRAELFEQKSMGPTFSKAGTTSWVQNENNDNKNFGTKTVEDKKSENERLLKEQNKGLESLLKIVTGQKQIATSINDEVEHHNEILVEIADNMERVDGRVNQARDMVTIVGKKDSIWGYWLVAFLLFIAILGVILA